MFGHAKAARQQPRLYGCRPRAILEVKDLNPTSLRMACDAARYSDPITFGWLIEKDYDVGVHCFPCGRHVVVPVRSLPFALEMPVPASAGRFKCNPLRITTDRGAS